MVTIDSGEDGFRMMIMRGFIERDRLIINC